MVISLLRKGAIVSDDPKFEDIIPLEYIKELVIKALDGKSIDKVFVLEAKTGSGKSTALPHAMYNLLKPKNVICTQPRVLTTQTIPKELAENDNWAKDMVMGQTIGYITGSSVRSCIDCLLYVTLPILEMNLSACLSMEEMQTYARRYGMIILDEVHERSIEFDNTIRLIKKLLYAVRDMNNSPFIVFTSATFDIHKYARFLKIESPTNIISVSGNTCPIKTEYLNRPTLNFVEDISKLIFKIIVEGYNKMPSDHRDILVFTPGASAIRKTQMAILNKLGQRYPVMLSILNRETVTEGSALRDLALSNDEMRVDSQFNYNPKGNLKAICKIYLGTDVAETGITIPTLGHVIDSGVIQQVCTYYPYGIKGLIYQPVAKSRSAQRRGRVGRNFRGNAYFMYTEEDYNKLINIQHPNIVMTPSTNIIMDEIARANYNKTLNESDKKLSSFTLTKLDLLDIPPVDKLKNDIDRLISGGIIRRINDIDNPFMVTEYGKIYSKIIAKGGRIGIELFRSILSAMVYGVSVIDIVNIFLYSEQRTTAAEMETKIKHLFPSFIRQLQNKEVSDYKTLSQFINDDLIEGIYVMDYYVDVLLKRNLSAKRGKNLAPYKLLKIFEERNSLLDSLVSVGINPFCNEDKRLKLFNEPVAYFEMICKLKTCIFDGYKSNVLIYDEQEKIYKSRFGVSVSNGYRGKAIVSMNLLAIHEGTTHKKIVTADKISKLDGYISYIIL